MRIKAVSMLLLTACLVLGAASIALASDPYNKLIEGLESQYHAKRKHIPLLDVGNFVLKFWHPAGVKGVRIALFEGEAFYGQASGDRLDAMVRSTAGGEWHSVVREFSRANKQWTYVYYTGGKDTKILIISLAQKDTVVAQVKFDPAKLAEFIQNPNLFGHSLANSVRSEAEHPGQEVEPADGQTEADLLTPVSTEETATTAGPKEVPALHKNEKGGAIGYREDALGSDPATPTEKSIKLEARLVNLNVSAVNRAGLAVPNLTKENFSVLENGVKQNIAFFETNDQPVNLMLLLDLSESAKGKIKLIKKAASRFVDSLLPTDRVAVAAFTRRFYEISDFTSDHKLLKQRIDHTKNLEGGTAYYDAMYAALNRLDQAGNSRKALVVLTDGVDESLLDPKNRPSKHTYEEMISRISEDDVTVYPIYLDTELEEVKRSGPSAHQSYTTARSQLYSVAEETGGTMLKAVTDADLDGAYQKVAAELHSLYSLAYSPKDLKNNGRWREIQVRTNRPDIAVRARRGFYDK
jgi:Ca-activated chloride channel family protein